MKCEIHLLGEAEDFIPKIEKLRPDDYKWLSGQQPPHKMNLEEAIRFLTMFNEVETIYFEVR